MNSSFDDDLTLAPDELDLLWNRVNNSPSDFFSSWISLASLTFAFVGSISNLMSVIVLLKLSKQLSTFVYLTSLSISDMITCLTVMIIQLVEISLQTRRNISLTIFLRYIEIFVGALAAGSRVLSLWISLAVTMDRWILICYPILGKRFCRIQRAKIFSRTLFFLAFIYSIPLIFEYEIIRIPSFSQMTDLQSNHSDGIHYNSLLITKGYSDLAKRRIYRWSYMFFNIIFVYLLPTLIIVALNLQLIRALHQLKSRRKRLKQVDSTKQKSSHHCFHHSKYSVTIMVIAIVLTLLLCRSPTIVLWILWSFELTIKIFFHSSFSSFVRRFHSIANLIAIINAATNFIPFCVFGQLFRAQCLNIYCCQQLTSEQLAQQAQRNYRAKCSTFQRDLDLPSTHQNEFQPLRNKFYLETCRSFHSDSFSGITQSPNQSSCDHQSTNIFRLSDSPIHPHNAQQRCRTSSLIKTPIIYETIAL